MDDFKRQQYKQIGGADGLRYEHDAIPVTFCRLPMAGT
jgi:hypothetical protein